jgi:hypothetical protein
MTVAKAAPQKFSDDSVLDELARALYWRGAPEEKLVSYAATLKDYGVRADEIADWAEVMVPAVEFTEVAKGVPAPATKRGGKILATVKMIASTDRKDLQGEKILQDGVMWPYFLEKGWINDVHDKGTGGGLGYPTAIKRVTVTDPKTGEKRPGTQVEGVLLDTQKARDILDLYKALDGHDRAIGSSIQGPVILRLDDSGNPSQTGRTIAKMLAIDLSLTRHPVNVDTYGTVDLCEKSLGALGRKLRSAMGGEANKDVTAGHPAPTYAGGGSLGPLMVQDHNRKGKAMKRCTDEKIQEYLDGLPENEREEAQKSLEAAGVEFVTDGAGTGAPVVDDAQKALDAYDAKLADALLKIKDHIEKGGVVHFGEAARAEATADTTGTLQTVLDTLDRVVAGQQAVAKGIVLLAQGQNFRAADAVKGLDVAEIATAARPDLSGIERAIGGLQAQIDALQKDLGTAGKPRYVPRPEAARVAERTAGAGLDRDKAHRAVMEEFSKAERIADDTAKGLRMDELLPLINALDAGGKITENDLTRCRVPYVG